MLKSSSRRITEEISSYDWRLDQSHFAVVSAKGTVTFGPPSKSMIYAKGTESIHYLTAIFTSSRHVFSISYYVAEVWKCNLRKWNHTTCTTYWTEGKWTHVSCSAWEVVSFKPLAPFFEICPFWSHKNAQSWLPGVKHALIHFITCTGNADMPTQEGEMLSVKR